MTGSLDPAQVSAYWRDGFLYPHRPLDRAEAFAWRERFAELERTWRDHGDLRHPFTDYCRANLNVVSTAAAELARHPAILDGVESILGPDLLCWMVEYIVKEPRSNKMLTVHQDLTYWGLAGADSLVTVWIALSDVLDVTGAMHFIRGSHRGGQVAHRDTFGDDNLLSRGQQVEAVYRASDEVLVELAPGEASFHHGLMAHGSGPNITDARRVAVVLRYVTPAVRQAVGSTDYAMLVRGENATGNLRTVPAPCADFDTAALDLFDEITSAQAAPLAKGADRDLSYTRDRRSPEPRAD